MNQPPLEINGARVVLFTKIDERHKHTGNCRHFVAGELMGAAAGLAVCQYEGDESFYLFSCDEKWNTMNDSLHETLEDAMKQADFEYQGTSKAWQTL